jgi:hypothetical protein
LNEAVIARRLGRNEKHFCRGLREVVGASNQSFQEVRMSNKQKTVAAYVLFAAMMSTACFKSKIVAKRVPTGPPAPVSKELKVNGVTYALPRTVVKISIPVKMTVESPGELEMFAPCFFSEEVASQRITAAGKSLSIEPATFSSRGEPDPNQHFIVKTKGGYFEHKSMLLEYTPEGVLTKAEAESKDESLEFAIATAKTIISIGAKAATPAAFAADNTPQQICRAAIAADQARSVANLADELETAFLPAGAEADNAKTEAQLAFASAEDARRATTEARARAAADAAIAHARSAETHTRNAANTAGAIPEKDAAKAGGERLKEVLSGVSDLGNGNAPTTKFLNDYEKAVEVSDTIKLLKEQREKLASGQVSTATPGTMSADTLKLMLKETDDTIEAYQNSYFLGITKEKNWTGAFEFTPPTITPGVALPAPASGTFFWFDENKGLCEGPAAVALGIKIPKKFKQEAGCAMPAGTTVSVRVERNTDHDTFLTNLNSAHMNDEARDRDRGFYYRVPAKAVAILQSGATELSRDDLVVAQYGIVASLPASSSGRTTQYAIVLDESTGALQNFKLASDGLLQKSILDDAATSANAIIDAKKARDKKKADEADELTKKKRELELLKTQNEINAEKKKLEGSGPPQ